MIDRDLAELYGVESDVLKQAVKRSAMRFPADFMFELTRDEIPGISQFVISSANLKFSKAIHAFTEQGVAMLSSVLRSERAILVNLAIMRAFVQLPQLLASHEDLARILASREARYDAQFKVLFDAIRQLMSPPPKATQSSMRPSLPYSGRRRRRAENAKRIRSNRLNPGLTGEEL